MSGKGSFSLDAGTGQRPSECRTWELRWVLMAPAISELLARHAFIDLETTGLDAARDEVIELGVVFVERGQVVRRLSKLFRASHSLPEVICRLTGLSDAQLESEPPFEDFAPDLAPQLSGWTLVAHNAGFEKAFLERALGALGAPIIDSCELLHLLHPELPSHSLEAVIKWAKVGNRVEHRALHDAEDTFQVVVRALSSAIDEVRTDDVADLIAALQEGGPPDADAQALLALLTSLHAVLKAKRARLTLEPDSQFLPPPHGRSRRGPLQAAEGEAGLDALYADHGALARAGKGFTARPAQLELAKAVAQNLAEGGTLAVEAGTGTGKSLGYLGPAALHAARTGQKVAVAPHTRALQDQLVDKDLPRLHEALGGGFGFAVLKGQSNYLCRRRALEVTRPRPDRTWSDRLARAYLRAFLRRSPDGDLDRLSHWFKERHPELGALVDAARSEPGATLGEKCPHYARCFYHSAVAQAQAADVLVVNQSLALAWPPRYPKISHLILDEAHELEDVASSAWTKELSSRALRHLVDRLEGPVGLLPRLLREAEQPLADAVGEAARGLEVDLGALEVAVRALCPERTPKLPAEKRVTAALRASRGWVRVRDALHGLVSTLALAQRALADAQRVLKGRGDALGRELASAVEEVRETAAAAELLADRPDEGRCDSVEADERGIWLRGQPIDIGPLFHAQLLAKHASVVLTSATLSVALDRPWVLERLGVARGKRAAKLLRLRTPFDLPSQALVVLVTDAPEATSDEFVDWSGQRISGLAQFLGGRVLGLFASRARLDAVAAKVRKELLPARIEVLQQARGAVRQLLALQEEDRGTVLLGTKTFWQGVDIPGPGVACVFIDKLPFEPSGRPLVEAREQALGGEGKGFSGYRLPRALLQLRQGVGRLLRSARDKGVVIIADPGSSAYRAQVYAALEGYRVEALAWDQARWRVHQSLLGMGFGRVPAPQRPAAPAPVQAALFDLER